MPKKFIHAEDVPCPTCGEPAGSPCRLRNGKPLSGLHCTDRIAKASGAEPVTPPTPPYTPGEAEDPTPPAPTATTSQSGPQVSPKQEPGPTPDHEPAAPDPERMPSLF